MYSRFSFQCRGHTYISHADHYQGTGGTKELLYAILQKYSYPPPHFRGTEKQYNVDPKRSLLEWEIGYINRI